MKVTYFLNQLVKVRGDQFEWIEVASDSILANLRELAKQAKAKDPLAVLAFWKRTEEELPLI